MSEITPTEAPISDAERDRREARQTLVLTALIVLTTTIFALAWFNAGFFVMLCEKIGLIEVDPNRANAGRPLDVYFGAEVGDSLPLSFAVTKQLQRSAEGVSAMNDYRFTNHSDRTIYFRPVHTVSPYEANSFLRLDKCFCFDEQKIEGGESYVLPVVYTFREEMPDNIKNIQMNYTLFRSTKERYEEANAEAKAADAEAPHGGAEPPQPADS